MAGSTGPGLKRVNKYVILANVLVDQIPPADLYNVYHGVHCNSSLRTTQNASISWINDHWCQQISWTCYCYDFNWYIALDGVDITATLELQRAGRKINLCIICNLMLKIVNCIHCTVPYCIWYNCGRFHGRLWDMVIKWALFQRIG